MGSTNKTEKVKLNQYSGSDHLKRVDYNADMNIIDAVIKQIDESIAPEINGSELSISAIDNLKKITLKIVTSITGSITIKKNEAAAKPLKYPNGDPVDELTADMMFYEIREEDEAFICASNNGAIEYWTKQYGSIIEGGYFNGAGTITNESQSEYCLYLFPIDENTSMVTNFSANIRIFDKNLKFVRFAGGSEFAYNSGEAYAQLSQAYDGIGNLINYDVTINGISKSFKEWITLLLYNKYKMIEVEPGEYIYNKSYETAVGTFIIPALENATWDEELKPLTSLPNGTKDSRTEKKISDIIVIDGTETFSSFALGQGGNGDLAVARIEGWVTANSIVDGIGIKGWAIANDGIGDYISESVTAALTGRGILNNNGRLFIYIPESDLETLDLNGLVNCIKKNNIKLRGQMSVPIVISDTLLRMNNPQNGFVYSGYKSKSNLFNNKLNNSLVIEYPIGSELATEELLVFQGSGVINNISTNGGTAALNIDGNIIACPSGKVDLSFSRYYKVLGRTSDIQVFVQHTTRQGISDILNANLAPSIQANSLQLKVIGRGVIDFIQLSSSCKLIVDGRILFSELTPALSGVYGSIKFYNHFELYDASNNTPLYRIAD